MKRPTFCLLLFAAAIPALLPEARAAGGPFSRRCAPVVVCEPGCPTDAGRPPAKREYQLWYYDNKTWARFGQPSWNAAWLHKLGNDAGRTHVHPKHWNENVKDAGAAAGAVKAAKLFTVTPAGGDGPVQGPTTTPKFCLHYCNGGWVYDSTKDSYQELYDDALKRYPGIQHLECSEPCEGVSNPPQYFTVCADGDKLGDGRTCCLSYTTPPPVPPRPVPVWPAVDCAPPAVCPPCPPPSCFRPRRVGLFGCRP